MAGISISPNPLVSGQTGYISGGNPGDVVDLDWDPSGSPTSVTLDAHGNASFKVPRGATSLIATGPTSEAAAVVVAP